MSPRLRMGLLLGVAVATLASTAAFRHLDSLFWFDPEPVQGPVDWWTLDVGGAAGRDAAESARDLSLPYARAGHAGAPPGGARRLDAERVAPGANLYVSAHGPEAILVDAEGEPLWRWRYPFERAFPGRRATAETPFWRRARLLEDGDLLVLVQGAGIFRLDRESRLRWASAVPAYNDLVTTPDGGILTLTKEQRSLPGMGSDEPVLEDFLVELDAQGRVRRRTSILRALLASPWASWIRERESASPDVLHTNAVRPLDGSLAAVHPAFAAGNVLLSLREIDALVVLDPRTGDLPWALRGAWRRQHDPVFLPDGELALFDNRGARGGGSRLLIVDPASGAALRQHPAETARPLRSEQAGAVHLLENGNLLVVESQAGRAFELAPDGGVVWEMRSPHRMGERDQFVAYLFDLQRVPVPGWLAPRVRG